MASKILEISEHSEIISEFSENLVHRSGVMYPRGHGPLFLLRSTAKKLSRARIEVQDESHRFEIFANRF
jgi:hypothetical protein